MFFWCILSCSSAGLRLVLPACYLARASASPGNRQATALRHSLRRWGQDGSWPHLRTHAWYTPAVHPAVHPPYTVYCCPPYTNWDRYANVSCCLPYVNKDWSIRTALAD